MKLWRLTAWACAGAALGACIPEGPATRDAPAASVAEKVAAPLVDGGAAPIDALFTDDFDRDSLGPDWLALSPTWHLEGGKLCGRAARNHGVWLRRAIPVNARIHFDAVGDSADGDLKAELWGDGKSGSTGTSYSNATSYLVILGGWKNTKHVLAKRDEHAHDRLELEVQAGADDERLWPVQAGQVYSFDIERSDGKTVVWSVDDNVFFRFTDPDPLSGEGHDHFGFNDWDAPVCFDHLRIEPS